MKSSEKYVIIFGGLEPDEHNKTIVEGIWKKAAEEVYYSTQIFVSAVVSENGFVCSDTTGCANMGDFFIQVTCVRNPELQPDHNKYRDAISKIVAKVKNELGEPYAAVIWQKVQFSFFMKK